MSGEVTPSEHRRSGPRAGERSEKETGPMSGEVTPSEHRRSGPRAGERSEKEPSQ
ncbi:hypothetical protein [Amycolatopsis aidingensis]|uniref:hypothetical protein n=1 Tax=Amycolatopsis aidingensis TaxID=2842453 RepID=UPI001C0C925E|nr:hypothetical protein [Amycolatopsis aidingensis]